MRAREASGAEQAPIVYARGRGSNVFDVDGNRYVDLTAGFGALVLGHAPNAATDAARAATERAPARARRRLRVGAEGARVRGDRGALPRARRARDARPVRRRRRDVRAEDRGARDEEDWASSRSRAPITGSRTGRSPRAASRRAFASRSPRSSACTSRSRRIRRRTTHAGRTPRSTRASPRCAPR